VGENWPVILPEIATSLPKERRAEDFFALKNPDGFSRV